MKHVIEQLKLKYKQSKEEHDSLTKLIVEKRQYVDLLHKVKSVLNQSIVLGNENAKSMIEHFVTEGLQLVYNDNLSFEIKETSVGGRLGYLFRINKNGHSRSLMCFGGGIRNIVSVILRFVMSKYVPFKIPFILDEVGSNISKEYQSKFGYLLKVFSEKLNSQIILITHQARVAEFADKVINVNLENERSVIQQ
mgnify:CR=1 FL=1